MPFGVVLNNAGHRFYDEGEDFWPKRYAIWGRLVAAEDDQIGHLIIDSKPVGRFMPPVFLQTLAEDRESVWGGGSFYTLTESTRVSLCTSKGVGVSCG